MSFSPPSLPLHSLSPQPVIFPVWLQGRIKGSWRRRGGWGGGLLDEEGVFLFFGVKQRTGWLYDTHTTLRQNVISDELQRIGVVLLTKTPKQFINKNTIRYLSQLV